MSGAERRRRYVRHRWRHTHPLHRFLVRVYNRVTRHLPARLLYAVGLRRRRRVAPYAYIRDGATVVQVGAPHDTLSAGRSRGMYFALLVGPTGRAVIIEPDPVSAMRFADMARRFGLANVTVHRYAAWSSKTALELLVDQAHPATNFTSGCVDYDTERLDDFRRTEVQADSLDNLLEAADIRDVDLVSITTNGAEREILDGLRRTMSRGLERVCLAETGPGYAELMSGLGYELQSYDDRGATFQRRSGRMSNAG